MSLRDQILNINEIVTMTLGFGIVGMSLNDLGGYYINRFVATRNDYQYYATL